MSDSVKHTLIELARYIKGTNHPLIVENVFVSVSGDVYNIRDALILVIVNYNCFGEHFISRVFYPYKGGRVVYRSSKDTGINRHIIVGCVEQSDAILSLILFNELTKKG